MSHGEKQIKERDPCLVVPHLLTNMKTETKGNTKNQSVYPLSKSYDHTVSEALI